MLETPTKIPDYAELFCLSNFSFLEGASHAEELAARAVQLGYTALAVTDECSLAGVVRAHMEAKNAGMKLIIGSCFRIEWEAGQPPLTLIALAQNREGYGNLSELITLGRTRADKGSYRIGIEDFSSPQESHAHLRGLPDCLLVLAPHYPADGALLAQQADWLARTFPQRAWLGLTQLYRPLDDLHRGAIQEAAGRCGLPVVALGQVNMHVRSRKPLQDTLTAIRLGKAVGDCGYDLAPNAEQHLRSRLRLANIFPAAALEETLRIASLCHFKLDELRYEYPEELVPEGQTPAAYLRQEAYLGAHLRYPAGIPESVSGQIEHELTLINDMAYEPYFLTVYDIVRFAKDNGILRQGRGSAANSVVCYCLGVTEVDPTCSTMLFERFISKERGEPPDIDVDFEHQRREEVIQYIYRKYGRMRAAIAAAVHTYRPRGVLRDVGKALGVDESIVDKVAKSQQWFDHRDNLLERFAECGLDPQSPIAHQWAILARQLINFPRHLSQHSGGFVIARDKLSRLVPIENAAMPDRSVIQWDKDDLESLGLLKVDVLALGMLSALRRALELVGKRRGVPFELPDIPREDPVTYDMICQADTIGVFQIESRAQMSMLPRLKPRRFYDLVVQVAIVRPGPIQGGMVHPFLRRRDGDEPEIYPNPILREALERTRGVPIFQEQVMQIAVLAAGFTPGEADGLRRAMAAWKRKGGMEKYQKQLIDGMLERGYTQEFADAIFRQIQGFGDYGFPESHAASFALLAYASSWIKCHEPEAFLCSLLNSQPMGFYSPSQLIQDARRHGVHVLPTDVTRSNWESTLEETGAERPAVRLGLSLIGSLKEEPSLRIERARLEQSFSDLQDLARRANLHKRDLQALAAGNALAALSGHRREALWQALDAAPAKDLLRTAPSREERLQLAAPSEAEDIVADYRSAGMTLRRHPLALLRTILSKQKFLPHDVMATFQDGQFARGCGIVTVRQRPGTAKGVLFITIEDETGSTNVIIWPSLVEKQRNEVLNASLLGVYGIWQTHAGVKHLVAKRLVDLSHLLGEINVHSRDFC
ncbi:DNA polymerase [Herbaspirillum hiltneri N3]|uniref:Error-prone DNA polymerase n=1 Tax=Herbaspirillum hiltneri N3 TaxID=1262470 RepID=A0ABM5V3I4_9BURK|nr:error-prone DNA polymerase [Herbaspirillum hiltneri]AKZ64049.1 DNA polymerase [Herbaspirillum hiltneri N3]